MNTYARTVRADGTVPEARHRGHVEEVAVPFLALAVVAHAGAVLPARAAGAAVR